VVVAPTLNRRQILSAGVLAGSAVAFNGAQARSITGEVPWQEGEANKPDIVNPGTYEYLTAAEVAFLDAAVSRLIPQDELGPGAKETGVTFFLDRQLAGPFGQASHWYMQGPWKKGEETQGYQSRMAPAELYRAAIAAIDKYCGDKFSGKKFSELAPGDQDQVLKAVEKGDADLKTVEAKSFFTMFLQNTIEGFFSDPIYGGNRDMAGWKLIGFPGARYDYRPYVKKHGQKLNLAPVGIKGRPGWNPA
jgi:gluconate 2-dehydrogenase gamma chain